MWTASVKAWVFESVILLPIYVNKDSLLKTQALSDAVYRTLQNLILRERISGDDYLYFNLASNRLNHAYGYRRLTAKEWMTSSDRVDGILQQMARVLNSNENFEMDDSFQLLFTQVRTPPRGSGHKRKMKPGHRHPETFKRIKQSVITIKNKMTCVVHALS